MHHPGGASGDGGGGLPEQIPSPRRPIRRSSSMSGTELEVKATAGVVLEQQQQQQQQQQQLLQLQRQQLQRFCGTQSRTQGPPSVHPSLTAYRLQNFILSGGAAAVGSGQLSGAVPQHISLSGSQISCTSALAFGTPVVTTQARSFDHTSTRTFVQVPAIPTPLQQPPESSPVHISPGLQRNLDQSGGLATGVALSPTRAVYADHAGLATRQVSLGSLVGGHFAVHGSGVTGTQLMMPARDWRPQHSQNQASSTVHHLAIPGVSVTLSAPLAALARPVVPSAVVSPQLVQSYSQLPPIMTQLGQQHQHQVASSDHVPRSPRSVQHSRIAWLRKPEEAVPADPEEAHLRKDLFEWYIAKQQCMKEKRREKMLELFFLQQCGNMADFSAFRRRPSQAVLLFLQQNEPEITASETTACHVINDEYLMPSPAQAMHDLMPPPAQAMHDLMPPPAQAMHDLMPSPAQVMHDLMPSPAQVMHDLMPSPAQVKVMTGKDGQAVTPVAIATQLPPSVTAAFMQPTHGQQGDAESYKRQQVSVTGCLTMVHSSGIPTSLKPELQQQPSTCLLPSYPSTPLPSPFVSTFPVVGSPVTPSVMLPSPLASAQLVQVAEATVSSSWTILAQNRMQQQQQQEPVKENGSPSAVSHPSSSPRPASSLTPDWAFQATQNGGFAQLTLQEDLTERANRESVVLQRVSELRKEGLWWARRLPRLQEPPRPRCHWDCLLEEMQWLATDFAQERKWKIAAAKAMSHACHRAYEKQLGAAERMEQEHQSRMRRIAAKIAADVMSFWETMQKVAQFKQQLQRDECRKHAVMANSTPWINRSMRGMTSQGRVRSADRGEDYESSIEEEEVMEESEGGIDHQAELQTLTEEASMDLDQLLQRFSSTCSEDLLSSSQVGLVNQDAGAEVSDDKYPDEDDKVCSAEAVPESPIKLSIGNLLPHGIVGEVSNYPSTQREISDLATTCASIQPTGHSLATAQVVTPAPRLLRGVLREYQLVGLDWLVGLWARGAGGILGDEPGLGKIVQTVALLAYLAGDAGLWGPHLVVCPSSRLIAWIYAFSSWCPGMKVLLYCGSKQECQNKIKDWERPNVMHVCITTYRMLLRDHRAFSPRRWQHIVLDAAQHIRDVDLPQWRPLRRIQSCCRLLLFDSAMGTGLLQLWNQACLLFPQSFCWSLQEQLSLRSSTADYAKQLSQHLFKVVSPFWLRRLRRDVESQMPHRIEQVLRCQMSPYQRRLYDDLQVEPRAEQALCSRDVCSVLHLLVALCRVCEHPQLIHQASARSPFVFKPLPYCVPSLVLSILAKDIDKTVDPSLFDLLGLEWQLSCLQSQLIKQRKVTRKLIEEITSQPEDATRLPRCKLKTRTLFEPVLFGEEPSGRIAWGLCMDMSTSSKLETTAEKDVQMSTKVFPGTPSKTPVPSGIMSIASTPLPILPTVSTVLTTTAQAVSSHSMVMSVTTSAANGGGLPLSTGQVQSQQIHGYTLQLPAQGRLTGGEVFSFTQLTMPGGGQARPGSQPVTFHFPSPRLAQLQQRLSLPGTACVSEATPRGRHPHDAGNLLLLRQPGPVALVQTMASTPPGQTASGHPASIASTILLTGGTSQHVAMPEETKLMALDESDTANAEKLGATQTSFQKSCPGNARLDLIIQTNERRCTRAPVYGCDLRQACLSATLVPETPCCPHHDYCFGQHSLLPWQLGGLSGSHGALELAVLGIEQRLKRVWDEMGRNILVFMPAVTSSPPCMDASHPVTNAHLEEQLCQSLKSGITLLHHHSFQNYLQLPDPSSILAQSGKLQALVFLLDRIKKQRQRLLLLSHSEKILDLLERFFAHRRLPYARVEGKSTANARRRVAERFRSNRRLFCLMCSTRTRCNVLPHTMGPLAVLCWDGEWDGRAARASHDFYRRVALMQDITVYRIVTEGTVEESLLKEATVLSLMEDLTNCGCDLDSAKFQPATLMWLFKHCKEKQVAEPLEDVIPSTEAVHLLEKAMQMTDDVEDVAVSARAELEHRAEAEDLQFEFGEESSTGTDTEKETDDEMDDVESKCSLESETSAFGSEVAALSAELTPIEKFALSYLEEETEHIYCIDRFRLLVRVVDGLKKGWEANWLQVTRKAEKRKREEEEEEEMAMLTYSREDASNTEYIYESPTGHIEIMPIWAPPTPPHDEGDPYLDHVVGLLYESTSMPEARLPPVFVRKVHKKTHRLEGGVIRKFKKSHSGDAIAPRSLFDRPTPALMRVRREAKQQKKAAFLKPQVAFSKPLQPLMKPPAEAGPDSTEWLIFEEWTILQAIQNLLQLQLNLAVVSPAHIPNWDLVSDIVKLEGWTYRSPKSCRQRYESVIMLREEGKLMYDLNPKKKQKCKSGLYKTKNSQLLRTGQIYTQDDHWTATDLYSTCFDHTRITAAKRSPPLKPILGTNPFQKNPKHAAVLQESGIIYDKPLTPVQVATLRADRITKEKKALAEQQRQQIAVAQQQQQQVAQQSLVQAAVATSNGSTIAANLAGSTNKVAVVGAGMQTASVAGNVLVSAMNAVVPGNLQAIGKRITAQTIPATVAGLPPVALTQQRGSGSPGPVSSEVVTIATAQVTRAMTTVTSTLVQGQRALQVSSGAMQPGKTVAQGQVQLFRQQTVTLQQLQQQQQQHQQLQQHLQQQQQAGTTTVVSQAGPGTVALQPLQLQQATVVGVSSQALTGVSQAAMVGGNQQSAVVVTQIAPVVSTATGQVKQAYLQRCIPQDQMKPLQYKATVQQQQQQQVTMTTHKPVASRSNVLPVPTGTQVRTSQPAQLTVKTSVMTPLTSISTATISLPITFSQSAKATTVTPAGATLLKTQPLALQSVGVLKSQQALKHAQEVQAQANKAGQMQAQRGTSLSQTGGLTTLKPVTLQPQKMTYTAGSPSPQQIASSPTVKAPFVMSKLSQTMIGAVQQLVSMPTSSQHGQTITLTQGTQPLQIVSPATAVGATRVLQQQLLQPQAPVQTQQVQAPTTGSSQLIQTPLPGTAPSPSPVPPGTPSLDAHGAPTAGHARGGHVARQWNPGKSS
uniref:E1A-binding protein p400-like isoform X3 n=1 Tax=Myxine glutinosa TaxID=7769 RepID=UPI00358E0B0B